ncbi:Homer protein 2, partial [Paragonimus skrjabini miyazakii]
FVDHFKQYVEASKGSPCTSASSNGRGGTEQSHSAGTDTTSLFPGQTTQLHSLVVDPPCTSGVPPGSLNSLNPTTLISGPISLLPASATTQPTDTASGLAYQPLPPLQWQQQLKQAQAHIRRLEDELNATKRQAASAGLTQAVTSVQTLPVCEIGAAPSDRGVPHLPGRAMISGLADGGIDGTIGLRDCLTRLDLSDPSIVNGAGEDWTRDTPSLNVKPTIPLLTQPGRSWCTGPETVRSLHVRLGHLLREAVELHSRLGALLPQSTPGGPPE